MRSGAVIHRLPDCFVALPLAMTVCMDDQHYSAVSDFNDNP
jgi:hypothetical protein